MKISLITVALGIFAVACSSAEPTEEKSSTSSHQEVTEGNGEGDGENVPKNDQGGSATREGAPKDDGVAAADNQRIVEQGCPEEMSTHCGRCGLGCELSGDSETAHYVCTGVPNSDTCWDGEDR